MISLFNYKGKLQHTSLANILRDTPARFVSQLVDFYETERKVRKGRESAGLSREENVCGNQILANVTQSRLLDLFNG